MTDQEYEFRYADITHAVVATSMAVNEVKGVTTDGDEPVFAVSMAGECMCGEGPREANAMISLLILADLLVELGRAAEAAGVHTARLQALVDQADAFARTHPGDADPRNGELRWVES